MRKTFTLVFVVSFFGMVNSQSNNSENHFQYHEEFGDPYLPNEFGNKKTSTAFTSKSDIFFNTQVNINHLNENILGDAANEPSIAIDPTDPSSMVIGWRQFDNINSNFRQAGFAYTEDGGDSWIYPDNIERGVFRSDPVLDSDMEGNFYYNSLTVINNNIFSCGVFKSETKGSTWNEAIDAKGGDKQWMIIDKTSNPSRGNIYAVWNRRFTICPSGSFTRSTNKGLSFDECSAVLDNPKWGTMAIGRDSDVYIGGVVFVGGETNITVVKSSSAKDPNMDPDWDFSSFVNLDGRITGGPPINPVGLLGQLSIVVDTVTLEKDIVYASASVERFDSDPVDVMFARSLDGGETWEDPIRINKDISTSNFQWFGTMSVAPDGRIDIIWLDTRDDAPDPYWSSLYYSFSTDQGESWSEDIRLSEAFDPRVGWPRQEKMGDYFHMISDNEYAHLAWANTFNNEQDVYYGRISPALFTNVNEPDLTNKDRIELYPNPTEGLLNLRFRLYVRSNVRVSIKDLTGKTVLSQESKDFYKGVHNQSIQLAGLANGLYLCEVDIDGYSTISKFMLNR